VQSVTDKWVWRLIIPSERGFTLSIWVPECKKSSPSWRRNNSDPCQSALSNPPTIILCCGDSHVANQQQRWSVAPWMTDSFNVMLIHSQQPSLPLLLLLPPVQLVRVIGLWSITHSSSFISYFPVSFVLYRVLYGAVPSCQWAIVCSCGKNILWVSECLMISAHCSDVLYEPGV